MDIIIIAGYNLLFLELVFIAWMAWRYNGLAMRGSGRYFGPMALVMASIVMRIDVVLLFGDDASGLLWRLIGICQLWAAVVTGLLVCEHLVSQLKASKRVLES